MIRQSLSRLCGRARVRSSDSIRSARRAPSTSKAVLATLEPLELRRLLSSYVQTGQFDSTSADDGTFGNVLATHDNFALIGQPGRTVGANAQQGQVYLVDTSTNTLEKTFDDPSPTPLENDHFGFGATFVGDKIAIGMEEGDPNQASTIYLYDNKDDTTPTPILATDFTTEQQAGFGHALASDGTYLYTSQKTVGGANPSSGAIYKFDANGNYVNTFTDADNASHIGEALALSGNIIYTTGTGLSGPVVVGIDTSDGSPIQSFSAPSGASISFGSSLAVSSNGELFAGDVGANGGLGAVYEFSPDGDLVHTYTRPADPSLYSYTGFGQAIAINDQDQLIISSPQETVATFDGDGNPTSAHCTGSVFIYNSGEYSPTEVITNPNPVDITTGSPDNFGFAVSAASNGKLVISDPLGQTTAGTGTVYVFTSGSSTNTAPSDVTIAGQSDAARLQTVSFAGAFTDPDANEPHTYLWDFGDGTTNTSGLNVTHAFTSEGTYTVTLTVTDSHQASDFGTFIVNVTANSLQGDILYVGGTAGTDSITVGASGTGAVTVNGTSYSGANSVVIYAGDGNDTVTAYSAPASTTLEIYGGAGDDSLYAGGANDIIVGGDGNDLITGGKGRDILIGGMDSDTINGDQDDDILIAGWTVHDNDPAALEAILGVWNSSASYDSRVAQLKDPTSGTLRPDIDVFDDGIADTLKGAAGTDFFSFNNETDTADVKKFEDASSTTVTTDTTTPLP